MTTDSEVPHSSGGEQDDSLATQDAPSDYPGLISRQLGRAASSGAESLDPFLAAEIESLRRSLADEFMLILSQEVTLRLLDAGTVHTVDLFTAITRGGALAIDMDQQGQFGMLGVYCNDTATAALLECILGGSPSCAQPLERELNELERLFLDPVIRTAVGIVQAAGENGSRNDSGLEMLPAAKFRTIVEAIESLSFVEFEIQLGGSASGSLLFCASGGNASLVARMGRKKEAVPVTHAARPAPVRRREHLGQIGVDLAVTLEGNKIRFSDLISLQVGDVIALESPLLQPLTATANGATVFAGTVSTHTGRRSFRVDRTTPLGPQPAKTNVRAAAAGKAI